VARAERIATRPRGMMPGEFEDCALKKSSGMTTVTGVNNVLERALAVAALPRNPRAPLA